MMFVELALQGIRGFPRLHRLAMRPGLNIARTGDPIQRRVLLDLLYHTLYPDPARGQATTALADPNASQSRVALTFYGRDKQGYRVIRDTVTGATKLYRYEPQEKKYRLFSEVSTEAAQYVRVQQQLPDEVAYERLFVFDPKQQPSLGGKARTRSGAPLAAEERPSGPAGRMGSGLMAPPEVPLVPHASGAQVGGFGSSMNMNNALVQSQLEAPAAELSDAEKRSELKRLHADLLTVVRGDQAQLELDRIQLQRNELVGLSQQLTEARARAAELERQLNPSFQDLPEGIADRIRTFEAREQKYSAERTKLTEEQDRLLFEADAGPGLIGDPYFLTGVGGAAACLGLAAITHLPGVALANLPFAVVAVGAALRWVNELEERYRFRAKATTLGKQLERIDRNHELDTAATRKLIKVLGRPDPSDLIQEVEAHEVVKTELVTLRGVIEGLQRNPATVNAERELQRLNAAARRLESEVMGASGSPMSAAQMRRRIRTLEEELGLPPSTLPTTHGPDPLMRSHSESGFARAAASSTRNLPDVAPWIDNSTVTFDEAGSTQDFLAARSLPPMPAPGEALVPTPDIPPPRQSSDFTGSVDLTPGRVPHEDALEGVTDDMLGSRPPSIMGRPTSDLPPASGDLGRRPVGRASSDLPAPSDDLGRPPTYERMVALHRPSAPAGGQPSSASAGGSTADIPVGPRQSSVPGVVAHRTSAMPTRETSVPGVVAHRSSTIDLSQPEPLNASPRPSASQVSGASPRPGPSPRPSPSPRPEAPQHSGPSERPRPASDHPFDFSGGYLTDDDDEDGYGSGYGGGGAGSTGDVKKAAPHASPTGYFAVGLGGSGGFGGGYGSSGYGAAGSTDSIALPKDRSRDLVTAAVDLLQVQVDDLGSMMGARLGQYLSAFTDKRFRRVEFGPRGEVSVAAKKGEFVPYPDLEDDDLDLVDASIKLALVELIVRQYRIPILLDDPFVHFPASRRTLVGQMLAYLSAATQVIVATPVPDLQGHPVNLDV